MTGGAGICCVLYAAKSTEDVRGSIPGQLDEVRETIARDHRRIVAAEYTDEAVSGYKRDRGPGLVEAMEHCEDLARENGFCELWAQHSDRLARGDGRTARHTVEVALWALKHDVRIRTVHDPDTFRDLLYAVVTGQRNHEDSRRKALAAQAGVRRAAARGEYLGYVPDGYRVRVTVDEQQRVHRAIELDPHRQALFELIYRLALRGRSDSQIAKAVNNAGWLTKPVKRGLSPVPFTPERIRDTLKNPRYAGLSTYHGDVVARDCWPRYITERQYRAIVARRRSNRHGAVGSRRESYLLAGLLRCGACGYRLRVLTGSPRKNGTARRTYVCGSHIRHRGSTQCQEQPIDAHMAEAMIVSCIGTLLAGVPTGDTTPTQAQDDDARARLHIAALAGGGEGFERALADLLREMHPTAALIRDTAISQRRERELTRAQKLKDWIAAERKGRTDRTRSQATGLNRLLRSWFAWIKIQVQPDTVVISAQRRPAAGPQPSPVTVTIDRAAWIRFGTPAKLGARRWVYWNRAEIIGALQAWADVNGRGPTAAEWKRAGPRHPTAVTLLARFGSWNNALRHAGLATITRPPRFEWDELDVIKALQIWARRNGRAPTSCEWQSAAPRHPTSGTVIRHFGRWRYALAAAGLESKPRPRPPVWTSGQVIRALRLDAKKRGHPPSSTDWKRAAPGRPSSQIVWRIFGSWRQGLAAAGLPAPPHKLYPLRWPERDIIAAIRRWTAEQGRLPLEGDWRPAVAGYPSATTAIARFGSWKAAINAAAMAD